MAINSQTPKAQRESENYYQEWVDKFKSKRAPKRTPDDCFTPAPVYAAVLDYVTQRYGIRPEDVVRPFWPGADYTQFDYRPGCVVVDNPPFSIITRICKWYLDRDVKFFLLAPHLTNLNVTSSCKGIAHIITAARITYDNGAQVATSFVTNLEPGVLARSAPQLTHDLAAAEKQAKREKTARAKLPRYEYPAHVLTAAMLGYMSEHGVAYEVRADEATFIRALDEQRRKGKEIFGSGYLLNNAAAQRKAKAAEEAAKKAAAADYVWQLSPREWEMVRALDASTMGGKLIDALS